MTLDCKKMVKVSWLCLCWFQVKDSCLLEGLDGSDFFRSSASLYLNLGHVAKHLVSPCLFQRLTIGLHKISQDLKQIHCSAHQTLISSYLLKSMPAETCASLKSLQQQNYSAQASVSLQNSSLASSRRQWSSFFWKSPARNSGSSDR